MAAPRRSKVIRPRKSRRFREHILIVTEGSKTEPNYFKDMVRIERITGSKIEVVKSDYGTDPLSVVDYAIDIKKNNHTENKKSGEPKYEHVYCVIDRDDHDHTRYTQACDKARGNGIVVIRSIPCFEIWYLLHKVYTTKAYHDRPKLISDLKARLGGSYEKSDRLYEVLRPEQSEAILRSIMLLKEQSILCDIVHDHPNPLTEVHQLVSKILSQKEF